MKYFSYTPDEGVTLHGSEDDARIMVEEYLDGARENSGIDGEWAFDVDMAFWGEVKARVKELRINDESSDYKLTPLPNTTADQQQT